MEKGLAEGMEKGRRAEQRATIARLHGHGFSMAMIASVLSMEEQAVQAMLDSPDGLP